MKELSVEEKAKRYDEALEKGKQIQNTPYTAHWDIMKEVAEHLLPELKECEGEKIRKRIIQALHGDVLEMSEIKEAVDWLENQGKHSNFLSKIQVGDKVTRNEDGVLVNLSQLNRVAKKQCEKKSAKFDDTNAKRMFIKALERVEEQNAKGYKLTDCDKNSWWEDFKAFCSEQNLANSAKTCKDEQDAAWSEKYIADVFEKVGLAKIVREQSNDALTNALQDAMIELSKFIPQPKQEWSEEDKDIINKILCICNDFERSFEMSPLSTKVIKEDVDKIDNWLKHLRPQSHWKPSDEQMNALNYVVNLMASSERPTENDLYYNVFKDLREQLKKLREEKL